jgi:hypothetical protein
MSLDCLSQEWGPVQSPPHISSPECGRDRDEFALFALRPRVYRACEIRAWIRNSGAAPRWFHGGAPSLPQAKPGAIADEAGGNGQSEGGGAVHPTTPNQRAASRIGAEGIGTPACSASTHANRIK